MGNGIGGNLIRVSLFQKVQQDYSFPKEFFVSINPPDRANRRNDLSHGNVQGPKFLSQLWMILGGQPAAISDLDVLVAPKGSQSVPVEECGDSLGLAVGFDFKCAGTDFVSLDVIRGHGYLYSQMDSMSLST